MASKAIRECVVYQVTNIETGNRYIGATTCGAEKRWKEHVYAASSKRSSLSVLCRAIRKYGKDKFQLTVLERCADWPETAAAEVRWIAELQPEYNATSGGEGVVGYVFTAEDKMKMTAWNKNPEKVEAWLAKISAHGKARFQNPEEREKILSWRNDPEKLAAACAKSAKVHVGMKHKAETIEKMVASGKARGMPWQKDAEKWARACAKIGIASAGRKHSPETIAKIGVWMKDPAKVAAAAAKVSIYAKEAALKTGKKVVRVSDGKIFNSTKAAAREEGVAVPTVRKHCKLRINSAAAYQYLAQAGV